MHRFFIFCALFFSLNLYAQLPPPEYREAEEMLRLYRLSKAGVVLKNENDLIPLQRLDTLKIGFIGLGTKKFQQTLAKYMPIHIISDTITKTPSLQKTQQVKSIFNCIIIGIKVDKETKIEILEEDWLTSLIQNKQVILAVWGDVKNWNLKPFQDRFTTIIYTPQQYMSKQEPLVAQAIFGGVQAMGKLITPIANNYYTKEYGIQTKKMNRLSYSEPESVGIYSGKLEKNIDVIVKEGLDSSAFPGVQVLVAKSGQVVFHKAYGYHTYDKRQKVKLSDVYDFASVTKISTGLMALMRLHSQGKFDLDANLETYFPKFKHSNKAELSMRSILAHNAQLQPWIPYWKNTIKKNGKFKRCTFRTKYSYRYPIHITDNLFLHRKYKKKIYKAIKDTPLNKQKGYKYSGLAFYLFPEMISEMVDMDFETYLKAQIYEPLGAYTLTYNPLKHFPLNSIIPTENDTFFRHKLIHGTVHDEGAIMMGGISGNAGLFGTANDLAKLMQMLLNKGIYGDAKLLSEATISEFTKCQYCDEGNRRGLGFDKPLIKYHPQNSSTAKDASPNSFGHSGYTGTFVWVDPDTDLVYIFFSNRVHPTRNNRKIYQLNIRPRIHQVIYDAMINK